MGEKQEPRAHTTSISSTQNEPNILSMDELEKHKENIQPLRQGRSAAVLSVLFQSEADESARQERLDAEKTEFERQIELLKTSDHTDPLEIHYRYVRWLQQNVPGGSKGKEIVSALEKAVRCAKENEIYRNDPRNLKLWICLAGMQNGVNQRIDIFKYLSANEIGQGLASFYEEYAALMEMENKYKEALEILELGIARKAQPFERLSQKYQAFLKRMVMPRSETDQATPVDENDVGVLKTVSVRRNASGSDAPFAQQQQQKPPSKGTKNKIQVYKDDPTKKVPTTNSTMPSAATATWGTFNTREVSRKENVKDSVGFRGTIVPQKPTRRQPSHEKFEIYRDPVEEIGEPTPVNIENQEEPPVQTQEAKGAITDIKSLQWEFESETVRTCIQALNEPARPQQEESMSQVFRFSYENMIFDDEEFEFEMLRAASLVIFREKNDKKRTHNAIDSEKTSEHVRGQTVKEEKIANKSPETTNSVTLTESSVSEFMRALNTLTINETLKLTENSKPVDSPTITQAIISGKQNSSENNTLWSEEQIAPAKKLSGPVVSTFTADLETIRDEQTAPESPQSKFSSPEVEKSANTKKKYKFDGSLEDDLNLQLTVNTTGFMTDYTFNTKSGEMERKQKPESMRRSMIPPGEPTMERIRFLNSAPFRGIKNDWKSIICVAPPTVNSITKEVVDDVIGMFAQPTAQEMELEDTEKGGQKENWIECEDETISSKVYKPSTEKIVFGSDEETISSKVYRRPTEKLTFDDFEESVSVPSTTFHAVKPKFGIYKDENVANVSVNDDDAVTKSRDVRPTFPIYRDENLTDALENDDDNRKSVPIPTTSSRAVRPTFGIYNDENQSDASKYGEDLEDSVPLPATKSRAVKPAFGIFKDENQSEANDETYDENAEVRKEKFGVLVDRFEKLNVAADDLAFDKPSSMVKSSDENEFHTSSTPQAVRTFGNSEQTAISRELNLEPMTPITEVSFEGFNLSHVTNLPDINDEDDEYADTGIIDKTSFSSFSGLSSIRASRVWQPADHYPRTPTSRKLPKENEDDYTVELADHTVLTLTEDRTGNSYQNYQNVSILDEGGSFRSSYSDDKRAIEETDVEVDQGLKLAVRTPFDPQQIPILHEILETCNPPLSKRPNIVDCRNTSSTEGSDLSHHFRSTSRTSKAKPHYLDVPFDDCFISTHNDDEYFDGDESAITYKILRKIGEGGFGAVYMAKISEETEYDSDNEDDDFDKTGENEIRTAADVRLENSVQELGKKKLVVLPPTNQFAFKVQKVIYGIWEYYVLDELSKRLASHFEHLTNSWQILSSVIHKHTCHIFKNESHLTLPVLANGTLLESINRASESGYGSEKKRGVEPLLAAFWTVELLRTIEALHAVGIVHRDVKVDNIMLRFSHSKSNGRGAISNSSTNWDKFYQADGSKGWGHKGITLIDWGTAVDLEAFAEGQLFVETLSETEKSDPSVECWEIRNKSTWTYEPDWYGLAGVVYTMIFGEYMNPKESSREGGSTPKVFIDRFNSRFWRSELWNALFDVLLNTGYYNQKLVSNLKRISGSNEITKEILQNDEIYTAALSETEIMTASLPKYETALDSLKGATSNVDVKFPIIREIRRIRTAFEATLVNECYKGGKSLQRMVKKVQDAANSNRI